MRQCSHTSIWQLAQGAHSAGYRTLAVRTRIARLDDVWRDTVLLERRSARG